MVIEFTCHQYGRRLFVREEPLSRQDKTDLSRQRLKVLGPKRLIGLAAENSSVKNFGSHQVSSTVPAAAPEDADESDVYTIEHEHLNWWIAALRKELESAPGRAPSGTSQR